MDGNNQEIRETGEAAESSEEQPQTGYGQPQTPPPDFGQGPPPEYPPPLGYEQTPPPGYQPPPPGYGQAPPPVYVTGYDEQLMYNRPIGFLEAYKNYWLNAFNFNDRTTRSGYWWYVLFDLIISIILQAILSATAVASMTGAGLIGSTDPFSILGAIMPMAGFGIVIIIWDIVNIIPGLSIGIRRLHDTGRRWPWIFINLIPIVGAIIFIVFMATASKFPPKNQFGILRQV